MFSKKFVLNFTYFILGIVVVNKLLLSSILFSISLIFVFKRAIFTKPLVSGIFLSTSPIIFSKFCLSVLHLFM